MNRRPRTITPAESARALAAVQALFELTPREQAELRVRRAKDRMTEAAQAVLDGHRDAGAIGDEALEELAAARAALALIDQEASK